MQYYDTSPRARNRDHSPIKSSPLRHTLSTLSQNSDSSAPSRQGTVSSNASSGYSNQSSIATTYDTFADVYTERPSIKRDRSESPVKKNAAFAKWEAREQSAQQEQRPPASPTRQSPKKLKEETHHDQMMARPVLSSVAPNAVSSAPESQHSAFKTPSHARAYSVDVNESKGSASSRNSLATLSRSDSTRQGGRRQGHVRFQSADLSHPRLDDEDLAKLQQSSTPQLRHLSKIAADGTEELTIHSPDEQVAGLVGRRRLQRSGSVRQPQQAQSNFSSQWQSTRWMESQRKHLQAYEYLCHIGEARAWLEDVMEPEKLPPIVQLEEALRDGVTLAEVVNILAPALDLTKQRTIGSLKIFRSGRLQFRHSDNIALFFRFLAAVELPDLFRFELVDLYEKKNIPKVIYCIHALSWLLYRQGVTSFTISHLVGQLEFTGEELEETQKGIDRSGIKMPDFGGMRKEMAPEPEPEPEPTPEELLVQHHDTIEDLQSQARGALVRMRLGNIMQDLWDQEHLVATLQAHIRGGFAREVFDFKYITYLSTRQFQAIAKAALVRRRLHKQQRAWHSAQGRADIVKVQSLWRGKQQRAATQKIRSQLQSRPHGIKDLQAAIRGALSRAKAHDTWEATQTDSNNAAVTDLQAAIRGMLERERIAAVMNQLWDIEHGIIELQAACRSYVARKMHKQQTTRVQAQAVVISRLQAAVRGHVQRRKQASIHAQHESFEPQAIELQSLVRGLLTRIKHARKIGALRGCETKVFQLQSFGRAMLVRRKIGADLAKLEDEELSINTLQAMIRGAAVRQKIYDQLMAFEKEETAVTQLQSITRAMLVRAQVDRDLTELDEQEELIIALQAWARGCIVRAKFEEKLAHYHENMQKVVKLQSFVRAKQQGKSYESLMKGANPPLPVVRRHIHLLTDSHLEFEGELEAERLRRLVVERVREVEQVEGYVEGLDVKVGLLVKNKISLDEVVKHQKHFGGSASQLLRSGGSLRHAVNNIDLKGLNKSSRKKLSSYEELFFHLQTQPGYLVRLLHQIAVRGLSEKELKNVERLIMVLFGSAHKSREEYLFLQLLGSSIEHTVRSTQSIDDFTRLLHGCFCQRLFLSYVRSPIYRSYLKQLLGSMVRDGICAEQALDLESDPLQIHLALINHEELSTGQPSRRRRDEPREVVIRDPDVRSQYVKHLSDLRDLCDLFFQNLESSLHRMPYGVRQLAAAQFSALAAQYPRHDPVHLTMLTGAWMWKSFLLPAFKEPEMWGVIDRGLSPAHKRNLAQVTMVLNQVCLAGRPFGADNLYLQPLNTWVSETLDRWVENLNNMFSMERPEEHLADPFSDLQARNKPTVYIKLADIFQIHTLITENVNSVVVARDDPIKELLSELGSARDNEADLSGTGTGGEITLTLKSRFKVQDDPHGEARALFTATKRLVLFIIRVQSGANLMEILLRPITYEDDDKWYQIVQEEVAEKERGNPRQPKRAFQQGAFDPRASMRGGRAQSVYSETPSALSDDARMNNLLDLESMTYAELKSQALENIIALENHDVPPQFRVSRHNSYQEILNALAGDIRSKHRRRVDRQRDIDATRQTLAGLEKKAEYLEEQLTSYNDYVEQCLHTLAHKKTGNKSFKLPFTRQWHHERELERAGRQPKFGSYKYSARQLSEKGVLMQWAAQPFESWGQLNFVISSDEVGVFHIEASSGSMMLPGASANVLLDELLQAQYDNKASIVIFDDARGGGAKLATNLLLHLVFKKFYRDE